jgi:hypothetical protein
MKATRLFRLPILLALFVGVWSGCDRKPQDAPGQATARHHEHKPPHQGTPVVLGSEEYHVELVVDRPAGKIQAYILDGEMENFVRIQAESFEVRAALPDGPKTLALKAVPNNATGEKTGDTSMFETRADWLKTNATFDATLPELTVRGRAYRNVPFNFPKGNDTDEK